MTIRQPRIRALIPLVAGLALVAAPAVRAAPPAPASGTFAPGGPPTAVSSRTADGNTIISDVETFVFTGTFTGTEVAEATTVLHPDGSFDFQATATFTGTVDGVAGTLTLRDVARGNTATSFTGKATIIGGTGGLADLHGMVSFEGDSATGAGTYSGQIHADP